MSQSDRFAPAGGMSRNMVIAGSVVVLHVAGIWALQSGLMRKAVEVVVPAEVLAEFIAPPAPEVKPPPPPPPPPPKPQPKQVVRKAPMPKAIADPTPVPTAPRGVIEPEPAPINDAPPAPPAPPAPLAPPAPPVIELPSSNAAYLNNPRPSYPAISRRMGEQGKVVLRVFIDAQGMPKTIEIRQSSGYERLDQQAMASVKHWRFVPGKRNGVPEAMWNIVPINFVLE